MSKLIINIADLTDPSDDLGRSYREVNNSRPHKYKLGQKFCWLDENEGTRYGMITRLTRDCDGTPLYTITEDHHGFGEESIDEMEEITCLK